MQNNEVQEVVQSLRISRVIVPVLIGLTAVAYLLYTQFDLEKFREIVWDSRAIGWIVLAFGFLLLRHGSYAMRMKALTGLSWLKCMELMVVWEFSTTLAPTSKGGPFVMMFALPKEGISGSKTVAAILYTIVLDSGFFVIFLPVLTILFGPNMLFPGAKTFGDLSLVSGAFFATYAIMATYWCFLILLLFIRPQMARPLMQRISRIPFLKKWKEKLYTMGDDFAVAAVELKNASIQVHLRAILGTLGAWTLKFCMINCLIIAVAPAVPLDGSTQLFIYARMIAMFILLAFSPTPGGAGIAEMALPRFISDFVPLSTGLIVALLWRGMAFYGYLLAGAIVVPHWLAKKLVKTKAN